MPHSSTDSTAPAARVRWGVLGTGSIASRFAHHLPYSRTGTLAAVGSRRADTAAAFAERHGTARAYGSYQDLLDDDTVDAVYVATPHPQHVPWAARAAEAGKHLLCEKPLAVNGSWAETIVEAARRADVFLMEAYMYRCLPQTALLTRLIREQAVGDVRHIQASFTIDKDFDPTDRAFDEELAGGGILDVGGYPVSMARLVAGVATGGRYAEPDEVTGVGYLGTTGVDEWALATLRFPGDITAQLATGVRLTEEHRLRIYGSAGYLEVPEPWLAGNGAGTHVTLHRVGEAARRIDVAPTRMYAAEADTVAAHLADRQAPHMSWEDTLGNAAVLDRWRAAIGMRYRAEADDTTVPTASGHPLTPRQVATMPTGRLPGLDRDVSRIVMGVESQRDLVHATMLFDDFVERGGNCFDTAWIYGDGRHQRLLGRWMETRGLREQLTVIGKGGHTPHCDPEAVSRQLGETLRGLRTEHLDVYLLHHDNPDIPVGEFVDVLDEAHRCGLIGVVGASNWSPERFDAANSYAARNGRQPFTVLSNQLSLARAYDVPWAGCRHVSDAASRTWLTERHVTLLPWTSQAGGYFADHADHAEHPEATDSTRASVVRCFDSEDNAERRRRARRLGRERGVAATAIALAWLLRRPYPVFPLIGPRRLSETRTSLDATGVTLSDEEAAWLDLRS